MSPLSRFQSTIVLVALALLAACAPPPPASVTAPPSLPVAGLERVMGKAERALLALFGEPDLDVREGHARKYQFAGPFRSDERREGKEGVSTCQSRWAPDL